MTTLQRLKHRTKVLIGKPSVDENRIALDLFEGVDRGLMLDVGACFGNTAIPFAERGWHVKAFEPDPDNRSVLEANLARNPAGKRVSVAEAAVADEPGQLALYSSPVSAGVSSLRPFMDSHAERASVPVTTLRDFCVSNGITSVDYLKIDVEGFEREVLNGYDWEASRPTVIVLEFEDSKTVPRGYSWRDLASFLADRGYRVVVSEWEPIVQYGTAHSWKAFKDYPCELESPESWGNLIAIEPGLADRLSGLRRSVERRHSLGLLTHRIATRIPLLRNYA